MTTTGKRSHHTMHLLPTRGCLSACGRDVPRASLSPEINEITCRACLAEHDAYMARQDADDPCD